MLRVAALGYQLQGNGEDAKSKTSEHGSSQHRTSAFEYIEVSQKPLMWLKNLNKKNIGKNLGFLPDPFLRNSSKYSYRQSSKAVSHPGTDQTQNLVASQNWLYD